MPFIVRSVAATLALATLPLQTQIVIANQASILVAGTFVAGNVDGMVASINAIDVNLYHLLQNHLPTHHHNYQPRRPVVISCQWRQDPALIQ